MSSAVTLRALVPRPDAPTLVLGPSLGTGVQTLWSACLPELGGRFQVLGWDLPGHGGAPGTRTPFELGELAGALAAEVAARVVRQWFYAGVSLGGAVGLHLAISRTAGLQSVAAICTGARIGTQQGWAEQAADVREHGTSSLTQASAARWFASGTTARATSCQALLDELGGIDDESYALACEALAAHDATKRLSAVSTPLLAVAGEHDAVIGLEHLRQLASAVQVGDLAILPGVAHLPPAEDPTATTALLLEHLGRRGVVDQTVVTT